MKNQVLNLLVLALQLGMALTWVLVFLAICLRPDHTIGLEEQIAWVRWTELGISVGAVGLAVERIIRWFRRLDRLMKWAQSVTPAKKRQVKLMPPADRIYIGMPCNLNPKHPDDRIP